MYELLFKLNTFIQMKTGIDSFINVIPQEEERNEAIVLTLRDNKNISKNCETEYKELMFNVLLYSSNKNFKKELIQHLEKLTDDLDKTINKSNKTLNKYQLIRFTNQDIHYLGYNIKTLNSVYTLDFSIKVVENGKRL